MRLDVYLVTHHLADSREKAKYMIKQGFVQLNNKVMTKPSRLIGEKDEILILEGFKYAGRGGYKLAAAKDAFQIEFNGATIIDVGCSAGGFTDFVLQQGARKVYAIDTGDILVKRLKEDPRVKYFPLTDVRQLKDLEERVNLVLIDVTFIPLSEILLHVRKWLVDAGKILALVKPPYEREGKVRKVKNIEECHCILEEVITWSEQHGFKVVGSARSPVVGKSARQEEFFLLLEMKNQ